MSRRVPTGTGGQFALRRARMAPGGRLRAEAPVRNRWTTAAGVEASAMVDGTAYHWAMDAASGNFPEDISATRPLIPTGSGAPSKVGYQVPPLAPGSTFAARCYTWSFLNFTTNYNTAGTNLLNPDPDGKIGWTLWMTRPPSIDFSRIMYLTWSKTPTAVSIGARVDLVAGVPTMQFHGWTGTTFHSMPVASLPDTFHFRWAHTLATGRNEIIINGSAVFDGVVLPLRGSSSTQWAFDVMALRGTAAAAGTYIDYDNIWMIGSRT